MATNLIQRIRAAFGKGRNQLDADQGLPTMQEDTGGVSERTPPLRVDGNPRLEHNRRRIAELRNRHEISDRDWHRGFIPALRTLNGLLMEVPGEDSERIGAGCMSAALDIANEAFDCALAGRDPQIPMPGQPYVRQLRFLEHACDWLRECGQPTFVKDRIHVPAYGSATDEWFAINRKSECLRGMFAGETPQRAWNALLRATDLIGEPCAVLCENELQLNATYLRPPHPPSLPRGG